MVDFYQHQLQPDKYTAATRPRVIIRCDTKDTIRQIAVALEARGQSYVAIHERFSDDDPARPRERKHVPDPSQEAATFWVHQFKLLEGIDDSRFQFLALYEELQNGRQFVQQVGRILRNPGRLRHSVAYVLDHTNGRQQFLWENYLQYETVLEEEGVGALDLGSKLFSQWQAAHPAQVYLDGRFRERFDLQTVEPEEDLQLPLSVNVFQKTHAFKMGSVLDALERQYTDQDRVFRTFRLARDTAVVLYLSYRNSPLLRTSYFMECKFGATIIHVLDDYVCHLDSSGVGPYELPGIGRPVSAKALQRMFRKDRRSRLTSVSLRNSNLGARALRTRAISSASIEDSAPSLDDHGFVCSTAAGYTVEMKGSNGRRLTLIRRYVGFLHGKITDASSERVTIAEYMDRLSEIAQVLSSRRSPVRVLERYAADTEPPANPSPRNVLLDLADVQDRYLTTGHKGVAKAQPMMIDDVCVDVPPNGRFSLVANGVQCKARIYYLEGRYQLESADLDAFYYSRDPDEQAGIVTFLNRSQSLRVIPGSEGVFYTQGHFFRPKLALGFLIHLLEPIPVLATTGSEKGDRCLAQGRGWSRASLFGIIDALGRGTRMRPFFGEPDIVVCDDMGTESADFLLADTTRRRVVQIHAKADSEGSIYSASNLQEVCGQATKNLIYLSKFSGYVPPRAHQWHTQPWNARPHVEGEVRRRIRRGPRDGTVWSAISSIMRDPRAECEVWLVLGQLISADGLARALGDQTPEALQAALLLFSTLTAVGSQAARLRVFCSP